ncbi:calcyclin-binding protein-like [Mytilus californianus]|uniref:calcyclin-binding protein-like n=1 Tax=Mytilus californianus TaxID=6549 RepID=UPI0022467334|nr:calcyclin-binding protein-like [Mytilus californianus]
MEKQIEELKNDIEEINSLLESACRTRVKDLLGLDKRKLETELIQKQDRLKSSTEQKSIPGTIVKPKTGTYTVTIHNYAWDQSEKFMKLYVTLNGVQSLPKDQVTSHFTKRSIRLKVNDLDGKNHELYISNLFDDVQPSESFVKIKKDTVLVMMRKDNSKTWTYVTQRENKEKEAKKPKVDENADPNDSLMTMMKQMYEDGDDEMKKTIAKAWSESRNKQSKDTE